MASSGIADVMFTSTGVQTGVTSGCSAIFAEIDMQQWLDFVPEPFRRWAVPGAIALLALLVLLVLWRRVARLIRRRRPPSIHPHLQKYNIDHAALDRERREHAKLIVATSTSGRLAGFRIVRQVEAVFVDGYRTPEDALIALKAGAAERGANGILNVKTERTAAGRCSASGDAIVVAPLTEPRRIVRQNPPPPTDQGTTS